MSARQRAVLAFCVFVLASVETSPGSQAGGSAGAASAKIWIGRQPEMEAYLRTAECLTFERLGSATNSSRCILPAGGPIARMQWMTLPPGTYRGFYTSYKAKVAAYELDKLLKLEMVPPTVERQMQGVSGAATLWVERVDTWKGDAPPAPNRAAFATQVSRMAMFDALIGNRERNQESILRDEAWNLILLDHIRAFGLTSELRALDRIDKNLWDQMLTLTRRELESTLRPWLEPGQITAILDRRERMKIAIERLIKEKGEAAVLLR